MISDFTPIVHTLEGRTIRVWAVADVHIGAKECDMDGFKAFLRKVQDEPDSYLVIVGDVLNNGIKDSVTNVYEETMPPSAQVDLAVDLLKPIANQILGCVGGNHERRTTKAVDLDPMFMVMTLIGKPELYRSNMAFIRVVLERGKTKNRYALMLTHGKTANKKRHFVGAVEGVDAIITAHTHDGIVEKPAKLVFTKSNRVVVKPLISLTATSWLGFGGYAANGLLLPKATSDPQCLVLEWSGTNARNGSLKVAW